MKYKFKAPFKRISFMCDGKRIRPTIGSSWERIKTGEVQIGDLLWSREYGDGFIDAGNNIGADVGRRICVIRNKEVTPVWHLYTVTVNACNEKGFSLFIVHTHALNPQNACDFVCDQADEETGCGPYTVINCFEGFLTNIDPVTYPQCCGTVEWNPPGYQA